MTAVAAAPAMSNPDLGDQTVAGHRLSRFTAVNDKDTAISGSNAEDHIPATTPMNTEEHGAQSKRSEAEEIFRENYGESDNQSQESSPSTNEHKRKRPESAEQESRIQDGSGSVSSNRPSEAPAVLNGADSAPTLEVESHAVAASTSGTSDTDEASQPPSNGHWPEYEPQLISQAQRIQQIDASDVQLSDALQWEAPAQELRALSRPFQSTPSIQPAPAVAFVTERPVTVVPPKRKRVFSKRTKTGCMTCRRRKKKCDEQHPSCESNHSFVLRSGTSDPSMRVLHDIGADDYAFQVTTASVVFLYVNGTLLNLLGKSPPTQRHPFHYSLKRVTQISVAG